MKRIALLTAKNHLIVSGGIGQFVRSFINEVKDYAYVDVIVDMPPANSDFVQDLKKNANFIVNDNPVPLTKHRQKFSFTEGLSFERLQNYSDALFGALRTNYYDIIVCNDPESLMAAAHSGMQFKIPVLFYTHNETVMYSQYQKQFIFAKHYIDLLHTMVKIPKIFIGTQSHANVKMIKDLHGVDSLYMPMPLPDQELRDDYKANKNGIIFIGRHEPRKNPDMFVKLVSSLKTKALVLTKQNSVKNFEADFKAAGITDYEIKADIQGTEKVDFIRSAKYAFHPSFKESFGFCAFETLHTCPTFLIEEYNWHENFFGNSITVKEATYINEIKDRISVLETEEEYDKHMVKVRSNLETMHQDVHNAWISVWDKLKVDIEKKRRPSVQYSKFLEQKDFFTLHEYFNFAGRTAASIEDISTVYNNTDDSVNVIQTMDTSYFSLNKTLSEKQIHEKQEESGESIFGWG